MKRLNPETGQPFERGFQREDGKYFFQYDIKTVKRNGFFLEKWLSEKALDNYKKTQRQVKKTHAKNNPDKITEKSNRARVKKLQRIPRWIKDVFIDEIKEFYKMAKLMEKVFPWKQHVDHIIPLKGKTVSGLHVPWNLQILSKKSNLENSNKYVQEVEPTPVPAGSYIPGAVGNELGSVSTPWTWEDGDDAHHHCGADARKDANRGPKKSSGDSVGHRDAEVGTPMYPEGFEDPWDTSSTVGSVNEWFERVRSQSRELDLATGTVSKIRQFGD